MPRKLMKVIWKVLSPGSTSSSSPSPPSPGATDGGQTLPPSRGELEGGFSLPVLCPETQSWGENPSTYARWGFPGHNGRDYGYHPIHPAGDGTIDRISFEAGGYGLYLRIDHGSFWTYYCHLSENSVRFPLNATVYPHLILAVVGSTGFSSGPLPPLTARRALWSDASSVCSPHALLIASKVLKFFLLCLPLQYFSHSQG